MTVDLNEKIIPDFDVITENIENLLTDINTVQSDKLFRKALGNEYSKKVKEECTSIKKRLYGTFNIVIIGDFKRGKSTLINAIIGENIAPTAVTPETVTINKISYSETPGAEAILKNGKKVLLSYNELNRKAIEDITKQLPAEIDFIDIKSDAEILKEISVIDTPGVGDLLKAFDQKVADYLVNADAIIYVISARSPLSISEQAFLSSAVLPQNFSRIFAVVNMTDTLETPENIQKITDLMSERISTISSDISLFMLSALDELCRKKELKRPEPELANLLETNFYEFETAINNDIVLQKDVIKSERAVSLTSNLLNEMQGKIDLLKKSIKANSDNLLINKDDLKKQNEALSGHIETAKTETAQVVDSMKTESKGWMQKYLTRIQFELESIQSQVTVSDLERYLQFYLSDLTNNAIKSCTDQHKNEISERLAEFSKNISNEITLAAFGTVDTQIASNITDISWTKVDSTFFVIDHFAGPFLGPLMIIGQAIAGFVRQSSVSKKQAEYLAPVINNFNSFVTDVFENLDTIYDELKLYAVNTIDDIYQTQINISLEAITQAHQIAADEEIKSEQIIEYLDSLTQTIEEHKEELNKYV